MCGRFSGVSRSLGFLRSHACPAFCSLLLGTSLVYCESSVRDKSHHLVVERWCQNLCARKAGSFPDGCCVGAGIVRCVCNQRAEQTAWVTSLNALNTNHLNYYCMCAKLFSRSTVRQAWSYDTVSSLRNLRSSIPHSLNTASVFHVLGVGF